MTCRLSSSWIREGIIGSRPDQTAPYPENVKMLTEVFAANWRADQAAESPNWSLHCNSNDRYFKRAG